MKLKGSLIWAALAAAICVPVALAGLSPLLEWRGPVYILAGFAGIVALSLVLVQPLLIAGYLPGLAAYRGRRVHHWIGGALVAAVLVHVGGLWITSPPDMIDALLFESPTPFSPFGVIAMWAIFAVALLACSAGDWDRERGASFMCLSRRSSSQAAWLTPCWSRKGRWRRYRRRFFARWFSRRARRSSLACGCRESGWRRAERAKSSPSYFTMTVVPTATRS